MRASHEDALFCDFIQYYGIREFESLPVKQEALLATSLPADSRTIREISGMSYTMDQLLLTAILDQLRVANWLHTRDAKKKRNYPKSLLEELINGPKEDKKKDEIQTFENGAAFERRLAMIRGEYNG